MNVNFVNSAHVPLIVAAALFLCIYFLISLRFHVIFYMKYAFKLLFFGEKSEKDEQKKSISSFRALFTAISGAAGLGNIAGVAIGITLGGPGTVFWILVAAIACMPLRFTEVYLGHKYRILKDGEYSGGPYYFIRNGLAKLGMTKFGRIMSFLYAFFLVTAVYGGATSFQTSQAIKLVAEVFEISMTTRMIISALLAGIVFLIVAGGIKRIGHYCSSAIMVFMSIYFVLLIFVMIYYADRIPQTFDMIMTMAFTHNAMYGGTIAVFAMAFQRLQLANETGFGTASIIHANSDQNDSIKEALISMTCPLIDAIFICFTTGLVICLGNSFIGNEGVMMVQHSLAGVSPILKYFLPIVIPIVSLNVMIAWSYYGIRNFEFLTKTKKFSLPYLLTICFAAFIGGVIDNMKLFIDFANSVMFLLFVPNAVAIFLLRKEVSKFWSNYVLNKKYDKNTK